MKKFYLLAIAMLISSATIVSCTAEELETQNNEEYQTDPNKNCPPNDTNCNGIPDDEER